MRALRERQYYDREFTAIIAADPQLRALARDTRGIAANNAWADGMPGPAAQLAGRLAAAVLLPWAGMQTTAEVLKAAVRRRKGGNR